MTGHPDTAAALAYLDVMERAIVLARAALLGEGSPTLFVSSEPYVTPYTAKSAAEVAEGTGPQPPPQVMEEFRKATGVDHEAVRRFIGGLCPAMWGDPADPMRCGLPSGHKEQHQTAPPVVVWAGHWQTAEAAEGGWNSGSCSTPGGAA